MQTVTLIGLDFGTTTSSAVAANALLIRNAVTGRTELSALRECYRSKIALTPMRGDRLDTTAIAGLLADWMAACGDAPIFGGGALLTGLTAQTANAEDLVAMIRDRIGDAVVARADDPQMESWLAFMGSTARLSRMHPDARFLNLDIGGGTTNIALGQNGEVLATGCLFIGARHVQCTPGTYRIAKLSPYAQKLFEHLGIHKDCGEVLTPGEVDCILDCYLTWLIAAVRGDMLADPIAKLHEQVPMVHEGSPTIVTLSGGVGELVYAAAADRGFPGTTAFGDLGIDFARHLLKRSPWSSDFRNFIPDGGGRATSFGLLRHSTLISGNTLHLSDAGLLPLRDIPILGTIAAALPEPHWSALLALLNASPHGGCVQIVMADSGAAAVRALGTALAESLTRIGYPTGRPLIVMVPGNVGQTLGAYIAQWGAKPRALLVLDEIPTSDARFVHIGRPQGNVVPVSFYGLHA